MPMPHSLILGLRFQLAPRCDWGRLGNDKSLFAGVGRTMTLPASASLTAEVLGTWTLALSCPLSCPLIADR